MTETTHADDTQTGYALTTAVYFVRALQATAALFSVLLVVGSLQSNVLVFLVVAAFVALLLLVILVLELVAVRGLRRWADG